MIDEGHDIPQDLPTDQQLCEACGKAARQWTIDVQPPLQQDGETGPGVELQLATRNLAVSVHAVRSQCLQQGTRLGNGAGTRRP